MQSGEYKVPHWRKKSNFNSLQAYRGSYTRIITVKLF